MQRSKAGVFRDVALQFLRIMTSVAPVSYRPVFFIKKEMGVLLEGGGQGTTALSAQALLDIAVQRSDHF